MSVAKEEEKAAMRLPAVKMAMASSSVSRRRSRAVRTVEIGELTARRSVKTTMSVAVAEMLIFRSAAMVGSSGAIMKPSVPIANVPSARKAGGRSEPEASWGMPAAAEPGDVFSVVDMDVGSGRSRRCGASPRPARPGRRMMHRHRALHARWNAARFDGGHRAERCPFMGMEDIARPACIARRPARAPGADAGRD